MSVGASIAGIIGRIVPASMPIATIVSGMLSIGAATFAYKDKGNGVVILLHGNCIPYWVSTQA